MQHHAEDDDDEVATSQWPDDDEEEEVEQEEADFDDLVDGEEEMVDVVEYKCSTMSISMRGRERKRERNLKERAREKETRMAKEESNGRRVGKPPFKKGEINKKNSLPSPLSFFRWWGGVEK